MEQILLDKAKQVLSNATEDNKETAQILIEKAIRHSALNINDFIGDEKPFNEIYADRLNKVMVATDKHSMLIQPIPTTHNFNPPAFDYKKVIPDIKNLKRLKIIDDAKLYTEIVKGLIQEFIAGTAQYINVAEKSDIKLPIANCIKMWQFGTGNWKSEGAGRPLIKIENNKTMLLTPAIIK